MVYLRVFVIAILLVMVSACNNAVNKESRLQEKEIVQELDGRILLNLKDAYLLAHKKNPKMNTAEWDFKVLNKGRYEVWLSSYAKDTMNLSYEKPVIVHFCNERLEKQPVGNEIVLDDENVCEPYFRADSKIGSILIRDSGNYKLQIISEKVLPQGFNSNNSAITVLDQIILLPKTH